MGNPMAAHLHSAGFALTVSDTGAGVVEQFVADHPGVTVATDPAGFADVDMLVLMLPSSAVVEAVLDGGVANALRPGTLVIDMSSSEPLRTRALAERLSSSGLRLLDAPVSGGVRGAVAGTLSVLVGGAATDLASARPLMEPLAGAVIHVGPVGSGHAAKAINNLISAASVSVTVEGLHLAERFGIAAETMTAVLNSSSGRSNTTENKVAQFMTSGTYGSGFSLQLMAKDVGIAVALARSLGQDTEVADAAAAQWSRVAAQVTPNTDHTAMYELVGTSR
ncbi:MAG: 3-hydroxyisobutyrate dehydrogenase [Aeromicrobium sp.]|nr:3-hydroxyisobutyrate dehydrogenase [Aeromicrobium sp.]